MQGELTTSKTEVADEVEAFEFDYNMYEKVSTSAELTEVRLLESNYWIKPNIFAALSDKTGKTQGFRGELLGMNFDHDKGVAVGKYLWVAEIKFEKKKVLKLKAQYLLSYSNLQEADEDHVWFYFEKVGRFTTYPYLRSLFSHHTSESGLMLPPLPSLKERVD